MDLTDSSAAIESYNQGCRILAYLDNTDRNPAVSNAISFPFSEPGSLPGSRRCIFYRIRALCSQHLDFIGNHRNPFPCVACSGASTYALSARILSGSMSLNGFNDITVLLEASLILSIAWIISSFSDFRVPLYQVEPFSDFCRLACMQRRHFDLSESRGR
jgi:hypothetical protein